MTEIFDIRNKENKDPNIIKQFNEIIKIRIISNIGLLTNEKTINTKTIIPIEISRKYLALVMNTNKNKISIKIKVDKSVIELQNCLLQLLSLYNNDTNTTKEKKNQLKK
jgi:hypothetical protein